MHTHMHTRAHTHTHARATHTPFLFITPHNNQKKILKVHITRELSSRGEEERRERERERERKEEGEREKFRYRCASRYFTTGLRYCASRLRYSEMLVALSY